MRKVLNHVNVESESEQRAMFQSRLAFTKSPNRKGLGKGYKGLETFDVWSLILCCFSGQLWQNFQISRKWDMNSQQPSANSVSVSINDRNCSLWTLVQVMACRLLDTKSLPNQCWLIFNRTLRNKFQWNFNKNSNFLIEENTFENVVCKSQPFCSDLNVLHHIP